MELLENEKSVQSYTVANRFDWTFDFLYGRVIS